MQKKFLFTFLLFISVVTTNFAFVKSTPVNPTNTEVLEAAPETAIDASLMILENVKQNLLVKEAAEGLTKKEQKALKKVNRKIKKLENKAASSGGNNKSWIAALLLSIFLGGLAIDRFYLGYIGSGILKLVTLGGFGVWYLIDLILIIVRELKPKDGEYTD